MTKATNRKDEELGTERLIETLEECRTAPLSQTLQRVIERVRERHGSEVCADDLSLLGAQIG